MFVRGSLRTSVFSDIFQTHTRSELQYNIWRLWQRQRQTHFCTTKNDFIKKKNNWRVYCRGEWRSKREYCTCKKTTERNTQGFSKGCTFPKTNQTLPCLPVKCIRWMGLGTNHTNVHGNNISNKKKPWIMLNCNSVSHMLSNTLL